MSVHSRVKDVKCKRRVTCRITYTVDGTENKNINITNPHNGLCVPNLNDPIVIDGFIDIKAKMKQLVEKKNIKIIIKKKKKIKIIIIIISNFFFFEKKF